VKSAVRFHRTQSRPRETRQTICVSSYMPPPLRARASFCAAPHRPLKIGNHPLVMPGPVALMGVASIRVLSTREFRGRSAPIETRHFAGPNRERSALGGCAPTTCEDSSSPRYCDGGYIKPSTASVTRRNFSALADPEQSARRGGGFAAATRSPFLPRPDNLEDRGATTWPPQVWTGA